MDIPALSMVMAQSKVAADFSTGMLSKSLDTFETAGDDLSKMMELSVNPEIGANIDLQV
ncbi:MAG TPA: YjfB family protein [Lachnospiraceae bacterium]|nr:YjfB family protein [Lachnospiraceae bacterium]